MTKTLLHIGYAKAGSTFLQHWFLSHPDFQQSHFSIGGFQDTFHLRDIVSKPFWKRPKYYVTSNETFSFGSPLRKGFDTDFFDQHISEYKVAIRKNQSNTADVLCDMFPGSKVLIVTRGFAGVLRSAYSESIKGGDVLTWDSYLDKKLDHFLLWLDINFLINLYADRFGIENLIILPYELLRDDKDLFLLTLEKTLGIDHQEISVGQINPSLSPEELFWYRLITLNFAIPITRVFPFPRITKTIYHIYTRKILGNRRLWPVLKVINSIFPVASDSRDFPANYLDNFRGLATKLKEYPLYKPYYKDYLL